MHKKIPKICTGCRVSEAKIYLYHSTKIAKARPHSEEWQTDTSVQKQWSMTETTVQRCSYGWVRPLGWQEPPGLKKKTYLYLIFKLSNFHKNLERRPLKTVYLCKVAEIGYPCWKSILAPLSTNPPGFKLGKYGGMHILRQHNFGLFFTHPTTTSA